MPYYRMASISCEVEWVAWLQLSFGAVVFKLLASNGALLVVVPAARLLVIQVSYQSGTFTHSPINDFAHSLSIIFFLGGIIIPLSVVLVVFF